MNRKSFFIPLVIAFLLFSAGSCEKITEEQCDYINKADMITKSMTLMAPSVYTGAAFGLTTIIKNVTAADCQTARANASHTSLEVEYREDESSQWQPTGFTVNGNTENTIYAPTNALDAGNDTGFEDSFKFADPGQYRFVGMSDAQTEVDERDEGNNEGGTDGSVTDNGKKTATIGYLTVLPSKDYVPSARLKSGKLPLVQYIGHKLLY